MCVSVAAPQELASAGLEQALWLGGFDGKRWGDDVHEARHRRGHRCS